MAFFTFLMPKRAMFDVIYKIKFIDILKEFSFWDIKLIRSWIDILKTYFSSLVSNKMLHCFNCYSSKKHIIFGAIHHRNSPLIIMLPCHVFIFVTMYNYNDKLLIVCTVWTRIENITESL